MGQPCTCIDDNENKKYGHSKFYELLELEAKYHNDKNHDYAKDGNPLGNFYRVSTILSLYPGLQVSHPAVVGLIYLLKQLDAAMWMMSNKHKALIEAPDERLLDVSIYSKLILIILNEIGV